MSDLDHVKRLAREVLNLRSQLNQARLACITAADYHGSLHATHLKEKFGRAAIDLAEAVMTVDMPAAS